MCCYTTLRDDDESIYLIYQEKHRSDLSSQLQKPFTITNDGIYEICLC